MSLLGDSSASLVLGLCISILLDTKVLLMAHLISHSLYLIWVLNIKGLFKSNVFLFKVDLSSMALKCKRTVLIQNTLCQQRFNTYRLLINDNNDLGRGEFGLHVVLQFGLLSPLLDCMCY